MAKRPLKLSIRIPAYKRPRNQWRRLIHAEVVKAQKKSPVHYKETDRLEVECRLYLNTRALKNHDVDNRLKDILDALQGRAGGPKNNRKLPPVIPNDNQIYRVIIEKFPCQAGSNGWGAVTIRRLPSVNIRWKWARSL
jgi:Holliday junction resolvase RusA-like endonuclease